MMNRPAAITLSFRNACPELETLKRSVVKIFRNAYKSKKEV